MLIELRMMVDVLFERYTRLDARSCETTGVMREESCNLCGLSSITNIEGGTRAINHVGSDEAREI